MPALSRRRVVLGVAAVALAGAAGCRSSAPLVPLGSLAMLPVRDVERYTIDERDIISRQSPPSAGGAAPAAAWGVQTLGSGDARRFHEAIAARQPHFARVFQARVVQALAGQGVQVEVLADGPAIREARQHRRIHQLPATADAFIDLTLSAIGYRASLASAAYTPEIYVEFDMVAKAGGSIDGAVYTYDIRPQNGDDRQLTAPADQLIARPADLIGRAETVVHNLHVGLARIADRVVEDVLIIRGGKPLP